MGKLKLAVVWGVFLAGCLPGKEFRGHNSCVWEESGDMALSCSGDGIESSCVMCVSGGGNVRCYTFVSGKCSYLSDYTEGE